MSRSLYAPLVKAVDFTLAFLFQPECVGCGAFIYSGPLCAPCKDFLQLEPPWCERCGEPLAEALSRCGRCLERGGALDRIRSYWWLNEAATLLVHHVKYAGKIEYLASILKSEPRPVLTGVLLPVPLAPARWHERGFNQAEWLADWVGTPLIRNGLIKVKETSPQSLLGREERMKNLRGVFVWNPKIPVPEVVTLLDDIYTTGSTLEACARALKKAGVKKVEAWTLFRVARH